jgi:membrane-associated protease RseP (regulator of RpoE activity)
MRQSGTSTVNVTLGAYSADRIARDPSRTYGFLGVTTEDPHGYIERARPGERIAALCQGGAGLGHGCIAGPLSVYLQLPVYGLSPLPESKQWLYRPSGALGGLGGGFWILADGFYWLFWLNFMVGTFNALPLLPLDGGHMYKDVVLKLLRRRSARPTPPAGESQGSPAPKVVNGAAPAVRAPSIFDTLSAPRDPTERQAQRIAIYTSLYVLSLVLWQFVGPRVGAALGG